MTPPRRTHHVTHELNLTGMTIGIGEPDPATGHRVATVALYDGDKPLHVAVERKVSSRLASSAAIGDKWTVALRREITL